MDNQEALDIVTLEIDRSSLAEMVDRWNRAGIRAASGEFMLISVFERPGGVRELHGRLSEVAVQPLPAFTDEEARRQLFPSLVELPTVELEATITVQSVSRDRAAGKWTQLADFHNEVLGMLVDERDRRNAALAALGDTFWDDDLDPA